MIHQTQNRSDFKMNVKGCDLCGATDKIKYSNPAMRNDIRRCTACGLIFTDPIPSGSDLLKVSSGDPMTFRSPDEINERNNDYYSFMLDELKKHVRSGRLLDVGCGFGHMLGIAKKKGFDVSGVEIQDSLAGYARGLGFNVFCGSVEMAGFPGDHFDVVTMWEVLEHVGSPFTVLGEINRIMKEGGILSIVVPNVESENARNNPFWWKQYHFYHFSLKALLKYLKKADFKIIKIVVNPHLDLKGNVRIKRKIFSKYGWIVWPIRKLLSIRPFNLLLKLTGEGAITVYAKKQ